jgi:hypothetical protein
MRGLALAISRARVGNRPEKDRHGLRTAQTGRMVKRRAAYADLRVDLCTESEGIRHSGVVSLFDHPELALIWRRLLVIVDSRRMVKRRRRSRKREYCAARHKRGENRSRTV